MITATGRGLHQRTTPDKHGVPRLYRTRQKVHHGFVTGDSVRAVVPKGKNAGTHVGRVAVRATGRLNITSTIGTVQSIGHKHVALVQRSDGYSYSNNRLPAIGKLRGR